MENNEDTFLPELIENGYGLVSHIMDGNYGLIASAMYSGAECKTFQVVFDTCDLWVHDSLAAELDKEMGGLLTVGTKVKYHAVRVREENQRGVRYMAVAVVKHFNSYDLTAMQFPPDANSAVNARDICVQKYDNLKVVMKYLAEEKSMSTIEKGIGQLVETFCRITLDMEFIRKANRLLEDIKAGVYNDPLSAKQKFINVVFSENIIKRVEGTKFSCRTCKVSLVGAKDPNVHNTQLLKHLTGPKHLERLQKLENEGAGKRQKLVST